MDIYGPEDWRSTTPNVSLHQDTHSYCKRPEADAFRRTLQFSSACILERDRSCPYLRCNTFVGRCCVSSSSHLAVRKPLGNRGLDTRGMRNLRFAMKELQKIRRNLTDTRLPKIRKSCLAIFHEEVHLPSFIYHEKILTHWVIFGSQCHEDLNFCRSNAMCFADNNYLVCSTKMHQTWSNCTHMFFLPLCAFQSFSKSLSQRRVTNQQWARCRAKETEDATSDVPNRAAQANLKEKLHLIEPALHEHSSQWSIEESDTCWELSTSASPTVPTIGRRLLGA